MFRGKVLIFLFCINTLDNVQNSQVQGLNLRRGKCMTNLKVCWGC